MGRENLQPILSASLLPVLCALFPSALLLAACGGPSGPAGRDPGSEPSSPRVVITGGPAQPRQGDVVRYEAELRLADDTPRPDAPILWSVVPPEAGEITPVGRFVGYQPGDARVVAVAGSDEAAPDTLEVTIRARGLSGSFEVVGRGVVDGPVTTTDLWVHGWAAGDYAYTGTDSGRLYVWDVSDPASPFRVDSVVVPASVGQMVNDVKIRSDGAVGVITHSPEGGITILDLSDPARPVAIERFDGVSHAHNVWIEGDHVYTAQVATEPMRVIDISDPAAPTVVAEYYAGSSVVHDVYVRDGLAFLSHMDAGLVIVDVGSGLAGGSPTDPVEVSRVEIEGGNVHNACYWPAGGYVFVGQEDFSRPGVMFVVDAQDLADPEVVATFGLPPDPPHNFWLDEEREILYMAWYSRGIRALDVSGELMGELDRQGREIASVELSDTSRCLGMRTGSCVWAPQLHDGLVFASDILNGLWVLRPSF